MSCEQVTTSRTEMLRLAMACELEQVRPAVEVVADFLHAHGAEEAEIQACELALVEALNNAVSYATGAQRREPVGIDVLCDPRQLEFRVSDWTHGFEWPAEVKLPEPEQETGRGLFLMQSVMDDVRYLRGPASNCLVMRKGRREREGKVSEKQQDDLSRKLGESEQIISDMAEELSFCYESLSAIFRCSAELGISNNLEEFSMRLLTDLAQITSADWFALRLLAKEESRLAVFAASDPALQIMPLNLRDFGENPSAEVEAVATRQDVWCDEERPLNPGDPLTKAKPGSICLIHPFFVGDTLIGTLTMGKGARRPHFTAVHANVIHTFADFLAIQIVNARFREEQVASRVLSRELEIARNIQRSLLPKVLPQVAGHSLAGFCESARQVGGDFYDVLQIGERGLLLIIADVMGKGIPAAIFAAIFRSLLRAVPEWTTDPAALLSRVNRLLYEELSGVDMFITAQLLYVDLGGNCVVGASAGHCPTLIGSASESDVRMISPEGLPLGILADTGFTNQIESLGQQHRVLLYTDGLTEARNAAGDFFGQERLMEWFRGSLQQRSSAEELKEDLARTLSAFQATDSLRDDQTFLIMSN